MTATACPHPFPFRFHRTLEQVDHDERLVRLKDARWEKIMAKRKAMAG